VEQFFVVHISGEIPMIVNADHGENCEKNIQTVEQKKVHQDDYGDNIENRVHFF
jgi:hypothetical protein